MLTTIRTFRNSDVESICRVWNEHFSDLGANNQILPLALELGCLAKPFFAGGDLLVAEANDQVVGFAHLARLPEKDLQSEKSATVAIAALCVSPNEGEASVAQELLDRCQQVARSAAATEIRFRPMLPQCSYYLGYGPADSMIGLTSGEQRTCDWIRNSGFQPSKPTNLWELDLARFQAPVDRLQLQIRRTAHVDRQVDEPMLPWWQACVLGHTEAAAFQLTDRQEKRVLLDVLFWTVAPELQLSQNSVAWLWPPEMPEDAFTTAHQVANSGDKMVFLLAESLRELQSENIDVVRTVSMADHTPTSQLLRRLGFKPVQSGMVFCKPLVVPNVGTAELRPSG